MRKNDKKAEENSQKWINCSIDERLNDQLKKALAGVTDELGRKVFVSDLIRLTVIAFVKACKSGKGQKFIERLKTN